MNAKNKALRLAGKTGQIGGLTEKDWKKRAHHAKTIGKWKDPPPPEGTGEEWVKLQKRLKKDGNLLTFYRQVRRLSRLRSRGRHACLAGAGGISVPLGVVVQVGPKPPIEGCGYQWDMPPCWGDAAEKCVPARTLQEACHRVQQKVHRMCLV